MARPTERGRTVVSNARRKPRIRFGIAPSPVERLSDAAVAGRPVLPLSFHHLSSTNI
ncbi:hypothetical protein ZOD2009_14821 [Haladaptatus paucihalophilus DX253]|uniref:Uncharacterized protein n=1 Tax=Haladaptatus paucihalophilus DX253 TaxID=797209 RepID=E7QVX6_HALPU|nr:hypothetical protein ZOD2009_14821 [Haladaptatus paucihalophilus DX253]